MQNLQDHWDQKYSSTKMQFLSEIFKYRSLRCFLSLDKTFVYLFSHLFNDENIKQTCFHTREKDLIFFFFQVWKWVNKRNRFFWWKKIVHGKKGKIHLRNQNSFFFFLRLSCKTFSFFFHVCFAIRIFPSCFFPICENSHTKKTRRRRRRSDKQHFFSCVKPKTSSRRWKKNLCNK